MNYICKKHNIGSGTYKYAYSTQICDARIASSHDFMCDVNPDELCIVQFKDAIRFINFTTSKSSVIKQFYKFKMKMLTDAEFKYTINEILNDETEPFIPPPEYSDFFNNECPFVNKMEYLNEFFDKGNKQFELINELKQMHRLGSIGVSDSSGRGGGGGGGGGGAPITHLSSFAPKLYQIRLDIYDTVSRKTITYGTPFTPDKMDEEIAKIPDNTDVRVLYLIERCGESIKTYIKDNPFQTTVVGQKVSDFIDSYVDATDELNCDFKPENLCPKYTKSNINNQIETIESIQMLDVDTQFLISENSTIFSKHAKVFMKFLFFSYFEKYTSAKFNDWHVSKSEVSDMINFFLQRDFMIYEYNPINMLYHYLIKKNSDDEFPHYDKFLKKNKDKNIISLFEEQIKKIPQTSSQTVLRSFPMFETNTTLSGSKRNSSLYPTPPPLTPDYGDETKDETKGGKRRRKTQKKRRSN
jgi:hypothetical protein